MMWRLLSIALLFGFGVAVWLGSPVSNSSKEAFKVDEKTNIVPVGMEVAILAGGCFWCMEPPFEALSGVQDVTAGYTGGHVEFPGYRDVSRGRTGHTEAVRVVFDPRQVSYAEILEVFWRQIDPTDARGQFADRGSQYRSGIYPVDEKQQKVAEDSKHKLAKSGRLTEPIVTEIVRAGPFYEAEKYHQDYYRKNGIRYKYYRSGSGRDRFLEKIWSGKGD